MTEIFVDIQRSSDAPGTPSDEEIESWIHQALQDQLSDIREIELCIRLVDNDESATLNQTYRNKAGATNVLSFPFEAPPGFPQTTNHRLLGDIIICVPLVAQEASDQNKSVNAHWAHLVVHGILHLLGYDHQDTNDAKAMERQEIHILSHFNITDPYQELTITHPNETD